MRQLILFDNAASARQFASIQVFDAHGDLIIDAASLDPAKQAVPTKSSSRYTSSTASAGSVSANLMLHRGAYSVVLSRRITDVDGNFAGVVAGAIRFAYFHDLFGRLRPEQETTTSQ